MNDICFLAVQQNGNALEFVLQKTHKMCTAAIMQNINSLPFVPRILIDNRMIEIILKLDDLVVRYKQQKWIALLSVFYLVYHHSVLF